MDIMGIGKCIHAENSRIDGKFVTDHKIATFVRKMPIKIAAAVLNTVKSVIVYFYIAHSFMRGRFNRNW